MRKLVLVLVATIGLTSCSKDEITSEESSPVLELSIERLASESECPNGGVFITTWMDLDGDGDLDSLEPSVDELICNPLGTEELSFYGNPENNQYCMFNTSVTRYVGIDINENGILEMTEVVSSEEGICNPNPKLLENSIEGYWEQLYNIPEGMNVNVDVTLIEEGYYELSTQSGVFYGWETDAYNDEHMVSRSVVFNDGEYELIVYFTDTAINNITPYSRMKISHLHTSGGYVNTLENLVHFTGDDTPYNRIFVIKEYFN